VNELSTFLAARVPYRLQVPPMQCSISNDSMQISCKRDVPSRLAPGAPTKPHSIIPRIPPLTAPPLQRNFSIPPPPSFFIPFTLIPLPLIPLFPSLLLNLPFHSTLASSSGSSAALTHAARQVGHLPSSR
jgi:hypothetical protein